MVTVTISIVRPNHGIQLITAEPAHLSGYVIYPDNKEKMDSAFPRDGVTITRKHQGHIVVAHKHMEKWVLSGFNCATVDLSSFSNQWKGCCLMIFSEENIRSSC